MGRPLDIRNHAAVPAKNDVTKAFQLAILFLSTTRSESSFLIQLSQLAFIRLLPLDVQIYQLILWAKEDHDGDSTRPLYQKDPRDKQEEKADEQQSYREPKSQT